MIIALSGYARAGKDTVADRLVVSHGFTRLAFADALKEAVYVLNPMVNGKRYADLVDDIGLDAAKAAFPEVRRLLQFMGTEVGRQLWGEDFWVDRLAYKVAKSRVGTDVVIPDCRFPNEARYAQFTMHGQVWRIHRPGVGPARNEQGEVHESETSLDDWRFDMNLYNDKTVAALHEHVDYLVEALL